MKKFYFPLLLCLSFFSLSAQWKNNPYKNLLVANVNSSDIQTANTDDGHTWIGFYSQNGNNYDMRAQLLDVNGNRIFGDSGVLVSNKKSGTATFVFNVCVDARNNFIIAFQLQKGANYECVIQKVNTNGKLLWGAGVDLGPGLSPYPVALTTNEIAVAWNNNGKIDYQKLSAAGVAVWLPYKEFTGNSNHIVSRAQLLADNNGGFSMVYQDQFSPPFYTNLFERRFNNNGNASWANAIKISTLTTASYRYYDVHIENDTTYVGYYGNPSGKNRFDAYVQRINPDGNLPWGINGSAFADLSNDNVPYEQTIYIAKAAASTDMWAVCTVTNSLQSASGIAVQKFNSVSGNKYLGNNGKIVAPIGPQLTSLASSKLSLCSDNPIFLITNNTNKLAAVKLNANGDFMWNHDFRLVGASSNSKFRYGFTDVYKGQAVAVWQEDKGSGDMPYAQNIRCDGSIGSATLQQDKNYNKQNAITFGIKNIYPNPVQNILSVTIQSALKGNVHFYVTDVSGNILKQSVQNIEAGNSVVQVDVSNIKKGTYFIKATGENNSSSALLFQKE
jgi:hypothetical protein